MNAVKLKTIGGLLMKPIRSFEEARAEVEKLRDGIVPVDENIKNLVAALRMFGIRTFQSCEGHADRGATHPFVQTVVEDLIPLTNLVAYHNRLDRPGHEGQFEGRWNYWVILPTTFALTVQPESPNRPLAEMHRDAEGFACTLQRLAEKGPE